jgi:hypothetical protein
METEWTVAVPKPIKAPPPTTPVQIAPLKSFTELSGQLSARRTTQIEELLFIVVLICLCS